MTGKIKNLISKQPVVVLVGHIDHGKSSILQKIKDFKITDREVGGITQHIGAYEVALPLKEAASSRGQKAQGSRLAKKEILRPAQDDFAAGRRKITFIDTPGHEAFIAMRARGARVADIAILVVAADEGIQPQTKEAISHIKEAGTSIIVAINKMDKPAAQPERIKDELGKYDILVEERGGKVPCVEVSAKTGKGISDLLDLILLVAEMENFGADINQKANGVVIESRMDRQRGALASLLVEGGVLKEEEVLGTSTSFGKIKRMEDFSGSRIKEVYPGQPVLVLGFSNVPAVGEKFRVFPSLDEAKNQIQVQEKQVFLAPDIGPDQKVLNLIVKTDVLGSIEPIRNVLKNLPQEKIVLKILKQGVGDINLSDIKLAETSFSGKQAGRAYRQAGKTIILGFRVKVSNQIEETAQRKNIKILKFDLIYDLVEGIRKFMEKVLTVEVVRIDLGELKTLLVFRTERKRQIVGARVLSGEIRKGVKLEVFRSKEETGELEKIGGGRVISLEKDKKEIDKGQKGNEVGILFEGDVKIQEDDILRAYERKQEKAEL